MRRTLRPMTVLIGLIVAIVLVLTITPAASAQDVDEIVRELERTGYYIEPGAEGSDPSFADLVRTSDGADDTWYFVSMADTVWETFGDELRDAVTPRGNVLVYFFDGDFVNVQLASGESESVEDRALAPFDEDWDQPEDFMRDVVTEFDSVTATSTSTSSGNSGSSGSSGSSSTSSGSSGDSGSSGGFPWLLVGIPVVLVGGGIWFTSRRGRKKEEQADHETAQKIRTELQNELDELANDVIVLSGPVDLSENTEAITHYREATDAYMDISDEIPDLDKLEDANLQELSELGARVAHARWQMDAAEAIIGGDPIPEKPKVEPPPSLAQRKPRSAERRQMPQRQPRQRVPYSRSRRRSGGGLLDILIAGSGMLGGSRGGRSSGGMFGGSSRGRSSGGMFGGSSRGRSSGGMFGGSSQRRSSTSRPRAGGGVFGSGSGNRSSSSRRRSSGSNRRATTSRRKSRSRSSSSRRSGFSSRSSGSKRRSTTSRRRRR